MADVLSARTRVALATVAREMADLSRGVVGDVSTPMLHGERIRSARRLRALAIHLTDMAVLVEMSDGLPIEGVASALGQEVADIHHTYTSTFEVWANQGWDEGDVDLGVGMPTDADVAGTADALDLWWARHAEPWESVGDDARPVGRALVDGQAAPGDR